MLLGFQVQVIYYILQQSLCIAQAMVFNKIDGPVLRNLIFFINFYFLAFVTSCGSGFHSYLLLGSLMFRDLFMLNVR